MLFEMAVADSYGINFEFCDDTPDRVNDLSQYYRHPKYDDLTPGHYTDDTQRSLANANVVLGHLLGDDDEEAIFNPLRYIREYQSVFKVDPRPGYSKRYEAYLRENVLASPVDFALKLTRKPSNGAVMGSAVFGFLDTPEKVMLAAAAQALSTHSYTTIPYAQIVALSAHYAINDLGKLSDLHGFLYRHLGESSKAIAEFLSDAAFNASKPSRVTMGASSAVKLLLYALPRHKSLSELIKLAVDVGGDTDSSAAIMVAVASESREYKNDLPEKLINDLEDGEYGRGYLQSTDRLLRSKG